MENIRLYGIRIFFAYWMLIEDWTLNIVCTYVGKCPSHNIWKCLVWQNLVEVEEQGQESILLSLSASKVSEACSFRFFQVVISTFDLFFVGIWRVKWQVTSFSCCQFNFFSIWNILSSSSSSCRLFRHPFLARAATGDLFRFFINRKWSFQKSLS